MHQVRIELTTNNSLLRWRRKTLSTELLMHMKGFRFHPEPHIPPLLACCCLLITKFSILITHIVIYLLLPSLSTGAGGHLLSAPTGTDDKIWTCDPLLPRQVLHQTELHPYIFGNFLRREVYQPQSTVFLLSFKWLKGSLNALQLVFKLFCAMQLQ